eukprot:6483144-Amphidinium_carterae.1
MFHLETASPFNVGELLGSSFSINNTGSTAGLQWGTTIPMDVSVTVEAVLHLLLVHAWGVLRSLRLWD